MTLRPSLAAAFLLLPLLGATSMTPPSNTTTPPAVTLLSRIDAAFRLPAPPQHLREHLATSQPAFVWPRSAYLSALVAASRLDPTLLAKAREEAALLDRYLTHAPSTTRPASATAPHPSDRPVPGYAVLPDTGPRGERYYDDNAWLVLAFLELHALTRDDADLARARNAWAFVASGEDATLGGGVWWRDKHDSKNTCSNAPAVVAALELHRVTGDPALLTTARRIYAWTTEKLQDPDDGLMWDTLRLDGSIEKTKWSYNAALMLRAALLLHAHEHTPDSPYLRDAHRIARSSLARWLVPANPRPVPDAPSPHPATPTPSLAGDTFPCDGPFAMHLVEALLLYADRTDRPEIRARVTASVRALVASRSGNEWYPKRWDAPKDASAQGHIELLHQAAVARAAALVDLPPTQPVRPPHSK